MTTRRAIIIGAGPAGLTAAYELATRSDIQPIVLERDEVLGGISRTVNYQGNRIDIGGHRFFSKSDRVMEWWLRMLPLEDCSGATSGPRNADEVMLVRPRRSRIYYDRMFFDYPISPSARTVLNLGLARTARLGLSYLAARARPIRPETSLEDFLVNRFGRELYRTFFESYTEKVWGVPCRQISAAWGAQRIKGLSIGRALASALAKPFRRNRGIGQKGVETSLIEQFLYPKYGPGQMWEKCADEIRGHGGIVRRNQRVTRLSTRGRRVVSATAQDRLTGRTETWEADFFFSTMPIRSLVRAIDAGAPGDVREISEGLVYRDFITVGVLARGLKIADRDDPGRPYPSDNWIYIQEPDVRVGRLQIFNNWSPHLVADLGTVWLGAEYFCNEGDDLWRQSDAEMARFCIGELSQIGILDPSQALDWTVLRVPKTYPAYFGTFDRFDRLRAWLDGYENLLPLGRNGMHRYNNQDHSMLTAMVAVDGILDGNLEKQAVWEVNTEQDYHETRGRSYPSAIPAKKPAATRPPLRRAG